MSHPTEKVVYILKIGWFIDTKADPFFIENSKV